MSVANDAVVTALFVAFSLILKRFDKEYLVLTSWSSGKVGVRVGARVGARAVN